MIRDTGRKTPEARPRTPVTRAAGAARASRFRWPWEPFIWSAIGLALTAGFAVGGLLFAVLALGLPTGLWWPAHAQIHGHVQLFGWAGLTVLGVGFHFLPRLRGAPLARPGLVPVVLWLLLGGLVLRLVFQPMLAVERGTWVDPTVRGLVILSAILELAGITLAAVLLIRTLRSGPPVTARPSLVSTLPFFAAGFAALWLSLALNLVAIVGTVATGVPLVPSLLNLAVIDLAVFGFLVPIAVAMSMRMFAIFYRMPLPMERVLRASLVALLLGLALDLAGAFGGIAALAGAGRLVAAAAFAGFTVGLGVFGRRRKLPHKPIRPLADPAQLHAVSAYTWLLVAAVLLAASGLAGLGAPIAGAPADAARHALGAGFVTLLIFGVGVHLLPSFAARSIASQKLVWATLLLGNLAALLRVTPTLLPEPSRAALALAGAAGFAAVAVFAVNVCKSVRGRPSP